MDVGAWNRDEEGTIVETIKPNAVQAFSSAVYQIWVKIPTLAANECIKSVVCQDATPQAGNVLNCWVSDAEDDCDAFTGTKFLMDSVLVASAGGPCDVGDTVTVEYFDSAGASLGTIAATVAEYDITTLVYRLTSADPEFDCDGGFTGVESITLTCA